MKVPKKKRKYATGGFAMPEEQRIWIMQNHPDLVGAYDALGTGQEKLDLYNQLNQARSLPEATVTDIESQVAPARPTDSILDSQQQKAALGAQVPGIIAAAGSTANTISKAANATSKLSKTAGKVAGVAGYAGLAYEVGSTVGNALKKQDEYGVNKSDTAEFVGSYLHPLEDIGNVFTGKFTTADAAQLLSPIPGTSSLFRQSANRKKRNQIKDAREAQVRGLKAQAGAELGSNVADYNFKEGGTPKKMKAPSMNAATRDNTRTRGDLDSKVKPTGEVVHPDKSFETFFRTVDPTGVTSWPAVYNSIKDPNHEDLAENMITAIPLVGKVKTALEAARVAMPLVRNGHALVEAIKLGAHAYEMSHHPGEATTAEGVPYKPVPVTIPKPQIAAAESTGVKSPYAMKEGGEIKGPGTAKSDSIKNKKLPIGSFVVPAENAKEAEMLREAFLGKTTKTAKLESGGEFQVSDGEHYFTPAETALLRAQGVDMNALAPNADNTKKFKKGGSPGNKDKYIQMIIKEAAAQGITDQDTIRAMIAIADHETDGFTKMNEVKPGSAGNNKNYASTNYTGRGFSQLTHEDNYKKATEYLQAQGYDVDLVANPEKASDPTIAAKILVAGLREGWFTGTSIDEVKDKTPEEIYQIVNPGATKNMKRQFVRSYDEYASYDTATNTNKYGATQWSGGDSSATTGSLTSQKSGLAITPGITKDSLTTPDKATTNATYLKDLQALKKAGVKKEDIGYDLTGKPYYKAGQLNKEQRRLFNNFIDSYTATTTASGKNTYHSDIVKAANDQTLEAYNKWQDLKKMGEKNGTTPDGLAQAEEDYRTKFKATERLKRVGGNDSQKLEILFRQSFDASKSPAITSGKKAPAAEENELPPVTDLKQDPDRIRRDKVNIEPAPMRNNFNPVSGKPKNWYNPDTNQIETEPVEPALNEIKAPTYKDSTTAEGNNIRVMEALGGANGLIALAQTGLGLAGSFEKRPIGKVSEELYEGKKDAIATQREAEDESRYGLSPEALAQARDAIGTNRATDWADITASTGNSSAAYGQKRVSSLNAGRNLVDLAVADEAAKREKKRYATSLKSEVNQYRRDIASEEQGLFDDKLNAFMQRQSANGQLINAGLKNYMESQNSIAYNKQMDSIYKRYYPQLTP